MMTHQKAAANAPRPCRNRAITPNALRSVPPLRVSLILLVSANVLLLRAQGPPALSAASANYLSPSALPASARDCLIALGDRLQQPGKERLTLTGQYTDTTHANGVPAVVIWEVPGRLQLNRTGQPPVTLDPASANYSSQASVLSQSDSAILESLLDDSAEAFLYGYRNGYAHRFLGGRFRTDGGRNPSYAGPWFDIHEVVARVWAANARTARQKHFFFDSVTKLLVQTTYAEFRGNTRIFVSTTFNNWTRNAGQAVFGQIVRKENGAAVFTFTVANATVGPTANDGTFPGH